MPPSQPVVNGSTRSSVPLQAQAGYRVVFLTRSGSQQPYDDVAGEENVAFAIARIFDAATGTLALREGPTRARVAQTVAAVQAVQQRQGLLTLYFTTVFEYVAVGGCTGWGV